jgi:hypothetical protein
MWHQVKAVFIPKPGRNSYCGPKDFRTISLTSFLLKTLERLVDRFLRDEILALKPLHPNQHAYQGGKSVETALHQLVVRVEKALDQQEVALGVFLDTEGHFATLLMTPCVQHLSDIEWIIPSYDGSKPAWRVVRPQRCLAAFAGVLRYP